jgi:hypothetical protein
VVICGALERAEHHYIYFIKLRVFFDFERTAIGFGKSGLEGVNFFCLTGGG